MKFFTFIMSFYILFLTCLPCGDRQDCNVKEELKISAITGHEGHDHSAETCTPFCTCSCCSVSAFFIALAKTSFSKPVFQSQKYLTYNITFNTEVYYSIWQPPQLIV